MKDETVTWVNEQFDTSIVVMDSIQNINHKPHPYMIGPGHMPEHSIYLDEQAIRDAESRGVTCYWKGKNGDRGERCTLPYHQHTADVVGFLKLQRDCTPDEIQTELLKIKDRLMRDKVDGVLFVENEGYRVKEATNETVD